jgi:hypothetical protein
MIYSGSAWAKGASTSAGKPVELVIRETDSRGLVASITSTPVTLASSAYQKLSVAYTAHDAGDQIDMYLRRPPGRIETGESFYAGALSLTPAGPPTDRPQAPA